MISLNHMKHKFIVGLQGIQEGILEVADKVNLKVQQSKILLEIRDLENKLRKNYSRLGELAYQLKDSRDIKTITEHPGIKTLLNSCRHLHTKISRLRERQHELKKLRLDDQMNLLKQVMEQQGMGVVRFTLTKNSPLKGCIIKETQLPPDVLILCVVKKNRLIIAKGDTRLDEQDSVFVLGLESEIEQLTEGLL